MQFCFEKGHYVSGLSEHFWVTPLILSFSPWEKGPLKYPWRMFEGPLSHGERDRVRGETQMCSDKPET